MSGDFDKMNIDGGADNSTTRRIYNRPINQCTE